jgi:hypothetical protein
LFIADAEENFALRFKFALTEFDNSTQEQFDDQQRFCVLLSYDENWSEENVIFTLDSDDTVTNDHEISIELPQSEDGFRIAFYAESDDADISGVKEIFIDDLRIEYEDVSYAEIVNEQIALEDNHVQLFWDKPSSSKISKLTATDDMYTSLNNVGFLESQLMVGNQQSCGIICRTMMKFDLNGINVDNLISAELNVKQFYAPGCIPATDISVYAITEEWNENSWDHNTHVAHSEQVWATVMYDETGWHTDDFTNLVTAWLNEDIPNHGFVMVAEDACAAGKLFSKDSADEANHPYLMIEESQTSAQRDLAEILSYEVYRNGGLISTITDEDVTEYQDEDLAPGEYSYSVKTVYEEYTTAGVDFPAVTITAPPVIAVDVADVEVTLSENSTGISSFNISNSGERDLTYSIVMSSDRSRAVGDVLDSWEVPSEILNPWGLGFDKDSETIWLSDIMPTGGNSSQLTEVSKTGEFIREIECPWIQLWIADMVVTDDYIYAMEVTGGGNEQIRKIDKESGELLTSISGEWSGDVTHAIALDEATNEFYISGWWQSQIFHVDSEGNTINTFSTENYPNIAGLAWNANGNGGTGSLWATGTNPYKLYEINPENGEILQSLPTYDDLAMYGLEAGEDGSLWMVNTQQRMVFNIDSGEFLAEVDWLETTPDNGIVGGGSSEEIVLSFNSEGLEQGSYEAYVKINHNAESEAVIIPVTLTVDGTSTGDDSPVAVTELRGNYPNPFNPVTTISFSLKHSEKVELTVYNVRGQKVKSLLNENLPAGSHKVEWNGTDSSDKRVSSGIYFYRMESESYTANKKMILMK